MFLTLIPHTIKVNKKTSSSLISPKDPCYLCIVTLTCHLSKNINEINDLFNAYLGFFVKKQRTNRHKQIIIYHVISNRWPKNSFKAVLENTIFKTKGKNTCF